MATEGKRSTGYFRFCKFTRALARPMSLKAREARSWDRKRKSGKKLMTSVTSRLGGKLRGAEKLQVL